MLTVLEKVKTQIDPINESTLSFFVEEEFFEEVQKKLEKLHNKALQFNQRFQYSVKEVFKKVNHTIVKLIEVTTNDVIVQNTDYRIIGMIEFLKNGNIIYNFTQDSIPNIYKHTSCLCEHCNVNRMRSKAFIVQNLHNYEFKQIGSACLKEYTSIDPKVFLGLHKIMKDSEKDINTLKSYSNNYFEAYRVLLTTLEVYKKTGYNKADTEFATYKTVEKIIKTMNGSIKNPEIESFISLHKIKPFTLPNLIYVKECLEFFSTLDSSNSYLHNIKVLLEEKYIHKKHLKILCSVFLAYDKNKHTQESTSKHIGNVSEKLEFLIKKSRILTSWLNDYGIQVIYEFMDQDQNLFTWKTSKYLNCEEIIGKKIKGTIKFHSVYNNKNQTELTRCKIL